MKPSGANTKEENRPESQGYGKYVLPEGPTAPCMSCADSEAALSDVFELEHTSRTLRRGDGRAIVLSHEEMALLLHMAAQPRKPLATTELRSVLDPYCPGCPLPRLNVLAPAEN